jgi:hypothetical protein
MGDGALPFQSFAGPDKDEPRAVGPGVLVYAVLVAGDGFEPPTFGL